MESTAGRRQAIIQLRTALHVSQARLAQVVNLSQSTISAWEQSYVELSESVVVEMGSFLIEQQQRIAALDVPKFATEESAVCQS